jgi:Zn-dependent membrane protease YugP
VIPGLLFAVAMAMHLVGTDQVLQERFRGTLTVRFRLVLAAGALTGWVVGLVAGFNSQVLVNLLAALLSGAILFNVVNDELPPDRHSSFGWFSTGLGLYAVLLVAATYGPK